MRFVDEKDHQAALAAGPTYTDEGGFTWKWNGTDWRMVCPECGERQDLDGAFHKPTCSRVS